jgi:hypothetical protein
MAFSLFQGKFTPEEYPRTLIFDCSAPPVVMTTANAIFRHFLPVCDRPHRSEKTPENQAFQAVFSGKRQPHLLT